ncbi:hypothetical protein DPMN_124282 [Dreissena polymorpha]|uniref:Uncharacterized protein n=1 Tax=Dreissena polymorpha TaxID=45954 RepID=A0A9D4JW35_DREPO|nr:hypothetical protein DPMN_124282 [Dreissena polymorpha]
MVLLLRTVSIIISVHHYDHVLGCYFRFHTPIESFRYCSTGLFSWYAGVKSLHIKTKYDGAIW